eukprot:CAMPEP_0184479428 /NCGR_PEP_ID=MMETSP0113_2-20130426/1158_1 /TAXON_ID=91329 /ORGANISM="Norrisiella sphaerica, Strain BC52" /LENGTH=577 /DNA_ID=CAMNT_0026857513 /DNA_START=224 /DNA_END=1957 /DNA_ORIENTATION=-
MHTADAKDTETKADLDAEAKVSDIPTDTIVSADEAGQRLSNSTEEMQLPIPPIAANEVEANAEETSPFLSCAKKKLKHPKTLFAIFVFGILTILTGLLVATHFTQKAVNGDQGFLPFPNGRVQSHRHIPADELAAPPNRTSLPPLPNQTQTEISGIVSEGTSIAVENADGSIDEYMMLDDPDFVESEDLTSPDSMNIVELEANNRRNALSTLPQVHGTARSQAYGRKWDGGSVKKTTNYPAHANGQIRIADNRYVCSGSLIAERVVVTNAHCIYDYNGKNWYSGKHKFCPGQRSLFDTPLGCFDVDFRVISQAYHNQKDVYDDWAILVLNEAPGVGYYGFSKDVPIGAKVEMYHYSCAHPANCGDMYYEKCSLFDGPSFTVTGNSRGDFSGVIAHVCDTTGGSSGASLTLDNKIRALNAWELAYPSETNYANKIRGYEYRTMMQYREKFNDVGRGKKVRISTESGMCLQLKGNSDLMLKPCKNKRTQYWYYLDGELHPEKNMDVCIECNGRNKNALFVNSKCTGSLREQFVRLAGGLIKCKRNKLCITQDSDKPTDLGMTKCKKKDTKQLWRFRFVE